MKTVRKELSPKTVRQRGLKKNNKQDRERERKRRGGGGEIEG